MPGLLLFHTWEEGLWLFQRLCRLPVLAVCVMPDHIHVVVSRECREELLAILRAFARWLNARRGRRGPVWRPVPSGDPVAGGAKRRRTLRYVHLNPVRARLVRDPLEWPLSTYRDALGLVVGPMRRPVADPHGLHAYTSSDPRCHVSGTELPVENLAIPDVEEVVTAVSAVTRTPMARLTRRGPARTLLLRSLRALTDASSRQICRRLGVCRRTFTYSQSSRDAAVDVVARVVGDPRFPELDDHDLRRLSSWQWYRRRRFKDD